MQITLRRDNGLTLGRKEKLKPCLVVGGLKEFKAQFYFIRKLNTSTFLF